MNTFNGVVKEAGMSYLSACFIRSWGMDRQFSSLHIGSLSCSVIQGIIPSSWRSSESIVFCENVSRLTPWNASPLEITGVIATFFLIDKLDETINWANGRIKPSPFIVLGTISLMMIIDSNNVWIMGSIAVHGLALLAINKLCYLHLPFYRNVF